MRPLGSLGRSASPPLLSVNSHGDAHFSQAVAGCRLQCSFCPNGLENRRRLVQAPLLRAAREALSQRPLLRPLAHPIAWWRRYETAKTIAAFRRAVGRLPAPYQLTDQASHRHMLLAGDDLLEFDGLFEVLDICKSEGRPVVLATPGLKLAEPDFAQRLRAYAPFLVLTCLACDAAVYERMTRLPQARDVVHRALRNVASAGFEFSVNFVITQDNFRELVPVAKLVHGELGRDILSCQYFIAGTTHLARDRATLRRLVRMDLLNPVLRDYAHLMAGTRNGIWLNWVPPCKLSTDVLASPRIRFLRPSDPDPDVVVHRAPSCRRCDFSDHCSTVTEAYHRAHPDDPYDAERVNAWMPRARANNRIAE